MQLIDTIRYFFDTGNMITDEHKRSSSCWYDGICQIAQLGSNEVLIISTADDISSSETFATILHEFIHIHCMLHERRCGQEELYCLPCPCERQILEEESRIISEKGEVWAYLKSQLSPSKPKESPKYKQLFFDFI